MPEAQRERERERERGKEGGERGKRERREIERERERDLATFISHRTMFLDTCLPWLRSITGIELTDTIDMTCSKYEYTGKPLTALSSRCGEHCCRDHHRCAALSR